MKTCTKCGISKKRSGFVKQKARKDGLHAWCKSCFNEHAKEERRDNPEASRRRVRAWRKRNAVSERARVKAFLKANPKRTRGYQLKSKFDITLDQYDSVLASQGGGCAICGAKESTGRWKTLPVDHDHKTGKMRGILCQSHNIMIGLAGDSIETLQQAIKYLKRFVK